KPLIKERHPPVTRSSQYLSGTTSALSPPPAPRTQKDTLAVKDAAADKNVSDVPETRPDGVRAEEQLPHTTQIKKKKDNKFSMNEYAQTNLRKGVALSGPEAPEDYALRYKAKVARPPLARQVSEYQKQFQWKDMMKTSPLLGAEEIVFRSKTDLGPYKHDGVPRVSEYRRQFHPWKSESFSSDVNLNINNNNNNNNSNNNNSKDNKAERERKSAKRSRSAEAVPDRDESVDVVKDQQAAESASSELKSKLKQAFGKSRCMTSEYRANYKSPTNYRYENGVWKGAFPPQLAPDVVAAANINENNNSNNNNNNNADSSAASNWFAEVIELRRRAEEYRKRAQGTHFSREHLVQLLAKQNECWDLDAEASSTIKALNLEKPALRAGDYKNLTDSKNLPDSKNVPDSKNLPDSDSLKEQAPNRESSPGLSDVEEIFQEKETPEKSKQTQNLQKGRKYGQNRRSRKMAWLEEQKEKIAQQRRRLEKEKARTEQDEDDDLDRVPAENLKARLPTPVLQQSVSPVRRHHLDLTTPCVGGAMLTCPPTRQSKILVTSRSGHSYVTPSDDYPAKSLQKTYDVDKLRTMPIYGRPSDDTHYLRNDSAVDSDKPLKTQYVASPPLYDSDDDKENQESQQDQKKSKQSSKKLKAGELTAVPEGYGRTYNLSKPFLNLDDIRSNFDQKDDDVMSVSLMSVASSCSLASDVLERTKKRQNFWNKKT
ncbi:unnamed protein product, partial [Candidula unifasciata]